MQKKKNGFLLFIFSFCPGAGEMYLGFMKMGVSLLGLFAAAIFACSFIGMPEFAVIPSVIYVYSFFHAHNIAGLDDERFYSMKDEYLFGIDSISKLLNNKSFGKGKILAIILCVLGIVMIWNASLDVIWDYFSHDNVIVKAIYRINDYLPRFIIGALVVILGARLLKGKKVELFSEDSEIEDKSETNNDK